MNKKVLISIIIAAMLLVTIVLSVAQNSGGSTTTTTTNNGNPQNPQNPQKPFDVDLSGYVANIGNATALGLVSDKKDSTFAMRPKQEKSSPFSLFSLFAFAAEDEETQNYIIMTTTEYDPNAPEADETGLTKVTFTKTITENVTTVTTGTKYIISTNGTITIPAVEGFTYNVYLDDTLVLGNITDNSSNDTDERDGIIVVDGLVDRDGNPSESLEYTVKYEGVGEEITITQDEINGEIDKLYIVGGYTFISFVPKGESQRPNTTNLALDDDGIAHYDKGGYNSGRERQSFVIDNATGYVYAIKNFSIDEIDRGIIISNGIYYDMTVEANGELIFKQIVMNQTLRIYDIFKDKYGHKYVNNNYLDAYDEENKTLYYTKHYYLLSREGVVIYFDNTTGKGDGELVTALEKINSDFSRSQISKDETYHLSGQVKNASMDATAVIIENGYFYYTGVFPYAYSDFFRVDTTTLRLERKSFGQYGNEGGCWEYDCLKSAVIDFNTVLMWSDHSGIPTLYCGKVFGENAVIIEYVHDNGPRAMILEETATILLENCQPVGWTFDIDSLIFRYTTFTQTIYYFVVLDENGTPTIVNSETYVAPDQIMVVFQPINAK